MTSNWSCSGDKTQDPRHNYLRGTEDTEAVSLNQDHPPKRRGTESQQIFRHTSALPACVLGVLFLIPIMLLTDVLLLFLSLGFLPILFWPLSPALLLWFWYDRNWPSALNLPFLFPYQFGWTFPFTQIWPLRPTQPLAVCKIQGTSLSQHPSLCVWKL